MFINKSQRNNGFTLLELLIVIGIIAIVGTIIVMILNPSDLFKQGRDAKRMTDLKAIDTAIRVYKEYGDIFKTSSIVQSDPSNAVVGLVRENCTGYSNCFTSLAAWQAAFGGINFGACAQGDLVCVDKVAVAKIDGTWNNPDTTAFVIKDWITGLNNYIRIYTTKAARHSGTWDTAKYRLEVSGSDAIIISDKHVRIEGLQVRTLSNNYKGINISIYDDNNIRIADNLIRSSNLFGNSTSGRGINTGGTINAVMWVWNNIIYDLTGSSTCIYFGGNVTTYTYNNTCIGGWRGFYGVSGNSILINNISQSSTYRGYDAIWGFDSSSDYNISSDSTAPGLHSKKLTTVSFISTSTPDYHLSPNDNSAKGAGMKGCSSSSTMPFQDDIDGQLRGGMWDIGADQVVPNYNIVFTSLPDNNSACCASYSLPSIPSDWTYGCVSETGARLVNGSGWIPVDFTKIPDNAFSILPIDPVNATSSGQYYTFVSDGKKWELTSIFESDKNKGVDKTGGKDGGQNVNILEIGSNLMLTPTAVKNRQ